MNVVAPLELEFVQWTADTAPRYRDAKARFDCGDEQINQFVKRQLHKQAGQSCEAYIAYDRHSGDIAGLYTLTNASIALASMSDAAQIILKAKKLGAYGTLPSFLLGRMGSHVRYKGQGQRVGTRLMMDALQRCEQAPGGWNALVLDSKASAKWFYEMLGFYEYKDDSFWLLRDTAKYQNLMAPVPPIVPPTTRPSATPG